MQLFKILLILFAGISLVGCRTMPPEPEKSICTIELIWKSTDECKNVDTPECVDWRISLVSCFSDINPNDATKHFIVPIYQYLKDKPVTMSLQDYADKIKWGESLKKWGQKNCAQ